MSELIAEARYRGRPVAAALGLTSKGREQIAVTFDFVDPAGTRLTWYGYFTDDTTERTIEALRACGWKGDDLSVFVEGQPVPEGFDQEVELVVKHETWEGKTSARIAFVNSGGGLALKNALTLDQAQSFAQRMRSRIGAFDRAAGRGSSSARPAARPAAARGSTPTAAGGFGDVPQEVLEAQSGGEGVEDVPY